MFSRKEKAENCYYPSFLRVDIDTFDDLRQIGHNPIDARTEAAFLHEYIHYLQDITTLSGYIKIGVIVDQMKWAITERKGKLRIPYDVKSTYRYNMCSNALAMEVSMGNFTYRNSLGEAIKTDIVSIQSFALAPRHIPVPTRSEKIVAQEAILVFTDQNKNQKKFSVGEFAISESMAYLIEYETYPNILPSPNDCPYRIVEKIIKKECPSASAPLTMIAICDVALNFPFPGHALYELIQKLKGMSTINPEIVYKIWQTGQLDYVVQKMISWESNLDSACQLATKQIEDYFLHEYWQDTKEAVSLSFSMGRQIRKEKPLFFLEIASNGCICSNRTFLAILSKCGSLCVYTPNDIYTFQPNATSFNIRPESFVCLSEIYHILLTSSAVKDTPLGKSIAYRCPLKSWCSNSFIKQRIDDITSTNLYCVESPWDNNETSKRGQCEFARLWYAFKLGKPYLRRDFI